MKKKNILLLIGIILSSTVLNVKAESHINDEGVTIDYAVVNEFKSIINEKDSNTMSLDTYNVLESFYQNGYTKESKIYVEDTLVKEGKILETKNYTLTEEEYIPNKLLHIQHVIMKMLVGKQLQKD